MAAGASGISQSNGPAPAPSSAPKASKGILGAVDGGAEPVFGVSEIEERKTGTSPEKKKQPFQKPAAQEVAPAGQEVPSGSFTEVEKLLEQTFAPKNFGGEISDEEAGLVDPSVAGQPGETEQTRGEQRHQVLANRLKSEQVAKEQVIQSFQQQANQFNQWAQNVSNVVNDLRVQNARLSAQLENVTKGQQKEPEDPIERLKGRIAPDLLNEVKRTREESKREVMALRQELSAERDQAHRQGQVRSLNYEADKAAREVFMKGFAEQDQQQLGHEAGTLTLAMAYGRNIPQEVAAQRLRQFVGRAALALIRSMSTENRKRLEAGQQIQPPTAPGRGVPQARGNAIPQSMEEMKKVDPKAKDALDFMFRNGQSPI